MVMFHKQILYICTPPHGVFQVFVQEQSVRLSLHLSVCLACLRFVDYRFVDYFALQSLIVSHKLFKGVLGGRAPSFGNISFRVWSLVSWEYDVLVFSV